MAIFNVTAAMGVPTTQAGDHAFDLDSPVADTLNVDAGFSLTALGAGSRGALLAPTGAWTVNIGGRVFSENSIGIDLAAGNTAVSTISIRSGGSVEGEAAAIALRSSATLDNAGTLTGTAAGLVIENAGTRNITNSGSITGTTFSIVDVSGLSNDSVRNLGTLEGAVSLGSGANRLVNEGTIDGAVSAGNGSDTISNSGTIIGNATLGGGTNRLVNEVRTALIDGDVMGGNANDTITNRGVITGDVVLGGGTNTLINSVTIGGGVSEPGNTFNPGSVFGGAGNDSISNSGTITGMVFLDGGTNTLGNSGTIRGNESAFNFFIESVIGGTGSDTVNNTGTIQGGVDLAGGSNEVDNSGTIEGTVRVLLGDTAGDEVANSGLITGGVSLGEGSDTITNSGTIRADVLTGGGIDTVTNTGIILGIVNLGNGNDTFNGGNTAETVRDHNGADAVTLAGSSDTYIATGHSGSDGIDTINAGDDAGVDTYDASAATSRVVINLGAVAGEVLPNAATGVDIAGTQRDAIFGFENAKAGSGGDSLFGTNVANRLEGGANNDFLFGFGGADTLNGGTGNDVIVGGAGRDIMTGDGIPPGVVFFGDVDDTFRFFSVNDSGVTVATRDVITDFQFWRDTIELNFDADTTNGATNDDFDWIGTDVAFSQNAGELRGMSVSDGVIVQADINGDAVADFSLKLLGDVTLSADMFVL